MGGFLLCTSSVLPIFSLIQYAQVSLYSGGKNQTNSLYRMKVRKMERSSHRLGIRQAALGSWRACLLILSDPGAGSFFRETSAESGGNPACPPPAQTLCEQQGQGRGLVNGEPWRAWRTTSHFPSAAPPTSSISCRKVSGSRGRARRKVHLWEMLCRRCDHYLCPHPVLPACILLWPLLSDPDPQHDSQLLTAPKARPWMPERGPTHPPACLSLPLGLCFFFILPNPCRNSLWWAFLSHPSSQSCQRSPGCLSSRPFM